MGAVVDGDAGDVGVGVVGRGSQVAFLHLTRGLIEGVGLCHHVSDGVVVAPICSRGGGHAHDGQGGGTGERGQCAGRVDHTCCS